MISMLRYVRHIIACYLIAVTYSHSSEPVSNGLSDSQDNLINQGSKIFISRCVLCHGETGKGDGKMSKIIIDPPPFDLTKSNAPYEYLRLIISNGGEQVGRSPQMPPWRDELSLAELDAVISYIQELRH